MKSEERKKLLMKSDIRVQVERGGVTQTIRGVLSRPAGRSRLSSRRKLSAHLVEVGQRMVAFVSGLLIASLYGLMFLLLQKQPLWFCVYTTLVLAGLAAFGMGLSVRVRASIMVMLPSLCSGHGRNFILLTFVSLLLSGPLSNTLENTERAASSLMCGAELAANQTQELLQKAATPLFSALDQIREISRNAYAVAGRVQKFIDTMADNTRHVARTLRNVLHFLADIGDVCNEKLGTPFRKCQVLFKEAQSDCSNLLGDFNFLCDIVDGFLPLCNLARAGEFFCIIPSYVADHLRKRLAAPFEKMKREFEFNISASGNFDLDVNSSRSLHQVSQDIMAEISSNLQVFQKLAGPLAYVGLILLICSFLRAVQYRHRYLHDIKFNNIYITAEFKDLNQRLTSVGGASVFPITCREAKTYITPLSFQLTDRERQAVMAGLVSVFRHLIVGSLLVALDFLVFWILDQVHHLVTEDIVARVPVKVAIQVNGSGYASDIYRDLVASFNILQQRNITVISRKCLLEPSEPNYTTCFILGFLLGLALFVSLIGGFMQRCRRLICASYHPEREQERIRFLRQHILNQRRGIGRALRRSATRDRTSGGGGRGRGGGGRLHAVLIRLPGGAHLSDLLGLSTPDTCLVCGEVLKLHDVNTIICDAPHCSGAYCRPCFQSLGNACVICLRPLTFQEDSEEEL
ncbi:DC-STAMP domain-containing protein 2 isoform X2 [Archocentrus centrarchus]|uniref:DC-STAMP domain-containing protein 2 isoform X2 n=1 Tax=Archocentrus centrarchus TaxID=63155 RepID=UPI0011E9D9E7|nr:DC-STAMP domain-containing protein 2 isoform X2 [Archocentrus centrarchus]